MCTCVNSHKNQGRSPNGTAWAACCLTFWLVCVLGLFVMAPIGLSWLAWLGGSLPMVIPFALSSCYTQPMARQPLMQQPAMMIVQPALAPQTTIVNNQSGADPNMAAMMMQQNMFQQ